MRASEGPQTTGGLFDIQVRDGLDHLIFFMRVLSSRTYYYNFFVYFRCIDIQQSNEGERTQALRLVRKVIVFVCMFVDAGINFLSVYNLKKKKESLVQQR